ncbi:MAG: hypothetical protein CL677_03935 [Bdellovibrionaceae bacterium]|nr:hypothetical protein [Pseudobdellovibrionaceae bacterium]
MKAKLNIMKKKFAEILKDESAQGATEYILLIVVILGIMSFFGPEIKGMVSDKMGDVKAQFQGFTNQ